MEPYELPKFMLGFNEIVLSFYSILYERSRKMETASNRALNSIYQFIEIH
jgi:hypothetical protein